MQREDLDVTLNPHGSLPLELVRRHSLQRSDGVGRVTVQVNPGTGRSWPVSVVVKAPLIYGEAPHQ